MTLKILKTDLLKDLNSDDEVVVDEDEIKHLFNKADLLAIWAAYQSGRPLLLRGKPGTGKSQLAKAIAHLLDWAFVSEVMHGGTQLEELHWHYDAINRLGEAQSLAYTLGVKKADHYNNTSTENIIQQKLDHQHFIRPGVFWWAFNWELAKDCYPDSSTSQKIMPYSPKEWNEKKQGVVLLIDEIDKAEPDLPNGLLQTLGELEFNVPYIHKLKFPSFYQGSILANTNLQKY